MSKIEDTIMSYYNKLNILGILNKESTIKLLYLSLLEDMSTDFNTDITGAPLIEANDSNIISTLINRLECSLCLT